jgi:hypothetical protein
MPRRIEMDGQRFDRFARTVAHGVTRRHVIGLLGGGFAAALLGRGEAAAKHCTTDADCAGNGKKTVCDSLNLRCVKPTVCDASEEVPDCGSCAEAKCDVASGEWYCATGKACTNGCFGNPITCACDTPSEGMAYCHLTDTCIRPHCRKDQFFDLYGCKCRCPDGTTNCGDRCCGPCQDCVHGQCKKSKTKCQSCRPAGGGGVGAVAAVRAALADVPECGPCEECDPDQGCKPKTCGACEECDQATGACVPKQCPSCEACQGGECVAVDCGDPCLECVNNSCRQKACGDCQECVAGDCRAIDCGDPCLECRNNACAPIECPTGKHCSGGQCVCDPASCDAGQGQTPDPDTCECICPNEEPACVIVISGVRFSECCPTTWVCSGGQCVCPEGQRQCSHWLPLPEEEQRPTEGRTGQCATDEACCLAHEGEPFVCPSPEGVHCCDARFDSGCSAEGLCQEICPGQIPCALLGLGEGCCIGG